MTSSVQTALRQILRPLVRLAIARRLGYPAFATLLKAVYVEVAEAEFPLAGRRLTDSRISLLTGLQRRDVHVLRTAGDGAVPRVRAGQLRRVLGRWRGEAWCDPEGAPLVLPRRGPGSFDSLVAEVSRDLHPRTILDQLLSEQSVIYDKEAERVALTATAPGGVAPDEAPRLRTLGANLGDHAAAAAANLQSATPPFFDRAVRHNRLSAESLAALDRLARNLTGVVLARLDAEALRLQEADAKGADQAGRFRAGAFIYSEKTDPIPKEGAEP